MMTYADQFREFLKNELSMEVWEANAVWFTEPDGHCYPAKYLGEELMVDIMNKFYEPLSFVREQLPAEERNAIRITVSPSYEDVTEYVVTYRNAIVLKEDSCKAWHFWFESDKKFDEWVATELERWKKLIGIYAKTVHIFSSLFSG